MWFWLFATYYFIETTHSYDVYAGTSAAATRCIFSFQQTYILHRHRGANFLNLYFGRANISNIDIYYIACGMRYARDHPIHPMIAPIKRDLKSRAASRVRRRQRDLARRNEFADFRCRLYIYGSQWRECGRRIGVVSGPCTRGKKERAAGHRELQRLIVSWRGQPPRRVLVRFREHTEAKLRRRRADRRERARNAHLLPRREHVQTIAGLRPRRLPPRSPAPRSPVELKFMKNDRRLSSVARKENPHCPRGWWKKAEDDEDGGEREKEEQEEKKKRRERTSLDKLHGERCANRVRGEMMRWCECGASVLKVRAVMVIVLCSSLVFTGTLLTYRGLCGSPARSDDVEQSWQWRVLGNR